MTSPAVTLIQSRDNALVKDLRRLAQDTTAYRKQGRVWLEGDHLCRAALERSVRPATVVLDRVQDAGNVGSILRSASAFGFRQVLAVKGSAALWSPKVLRAGMGAHFALNLVEGVSEEDLAALQVPLVVTSSHGGSYLHQADLPWPCAWVMGHEGQGVAPSLEARSSLRIRIAQPGGEESLNVAAAAAICLHASGAAR